MLAYFESGECKKRDLRKFSYPNALFNRTSLTLVHKFFNSASFSDANKVFDIDSFNIMNICDFFCKNHKTKTNISNFTVVMLTLRHINTKQLFFLLVKYSRKIHVNNMVIYKYI